MKKLIMMIRHKIAYRGSLIYIWAMNKMLNMIVRENLMPIEWVKERRDILCESRYEVMKCRKYTEDNLCNLIDEILTLQDVWDELIELGDSLNT